MAGHLGAERAHSTRAAVVASCVPPNAPFAFLVCGPAGEIGSPLLATALLLLAMGVGAWAQQLGTGSFARLWRRGWRFGQCRFPFWPLRSCVTSHGAECECVVY